MNDDELIAVVIAVAVMFVFGVFWRLIQRRSQRVYQWDNWWDEHQQTAGHIFWHGVMQEMMNASIRSLDCNKDSYQDMPRSASSAEVDFAHCSYQDIVDALNDICERERETQDMYALHAAFAIQTERKKFRFYPVITASNEILYMHIR